MFKWLITYIPFGSTVTTKTTEVVGASKLEAQQYFSQHYIGKIVSIEQKF